MKGPMYFPEPRWLQTSCSEAVAQFRAEVQSIRKWGVRMGIYDEVLVPCPACGHKYDFQTKACGSNMTAWEHYEAPSLALADVADGCPVATCEKCGTSFQIAFYGHLVITRV